jgi:hypothetical protein
VFERNQRRGAEAYAPQSHVFDPTFPPLIHGDPLVPRQCSSCSLEPPLRQELDRRIKSGATLPDLNRWLASKDVKLSVNALSRHRQHVLLRPTAPGPRPKSASFLEDVEAIAHDDMVAGVLRPSIRDAIAARGELNKQQARNQDRDLMAKIALALSGAAVPIEARVIDPEVAAIEAEFRPLLTSGYVPER